MLLNHFNHSVLGTAHRALLVVAAAALLALPVALAQDASDLATQTPGEPYVSVDSILPLPAFIPGVGALYIDPANAPTGPWLAYGSDDTLVEVLYMVPISGMEDATDWSDLGAGLVASLGLTVDHVDITYNGGHPGMAEPHYHVRLVFVDAGTQEQLLNP